MTPLSPQKIKQVIIVVVVAIVLLLSAYVSLPPSSFPRSTVVTIEPGETLTQVTQQLRAVGAIRSSSLFQSLAIIFGGERKTIAGDYLLKNPENVLSLAWRVVHGDFGQPEVKITIPEGFSNQQIADALAKKLPQFDEGNFLALAASNAGYLFPDTYFFQLSATSTEIIGRMKENFDVKIAPFEPSILASGRTQQDIITMASILEAEATSTVDREIIAGILWKRIAAGIALQVDSASETYKVRGLPQSPINNPGINSIVAAFNPKPSLYLYYLTGNDGAMHYAVTFVEHQKNIQKYLK